MNTRLHSTAITGVKRAENEIAKIWRNEGLTKHLSGKENLERINEWYDRLLDWESLLPLRYRRKSQMKNNGQGKQVCNVQMKIIYNRLKNQ